MAKRGTKAEWQDKVLEMLQEDPDITQQEREQIVDYLAKNFPPKAAIRRVSMKKVPAVRPLTRASY